MVDTAVRILLIPLRKALLNILLPGVAVNRKPLEIADPEVCDFLGNRKPPLIDCILYVNHGVTSTGLASVEQCIAQ